MPLIISLCLPEYPLHPTAPTGSYTTLKLDAATDPTHFTVAVAVAVLTKLRLHNMVDVLAKCDAPLGFGRICKAPQTSWSICFNVAGGQS